MLSPIEKELINRALLYEVIYDKSLKFNPGLFFPECFYSFIVLIQSALIGWITWIHAVKYLPLIGQELTLLLQPFNPLQESTLHCWNA